MTALSASGDAPSSPPSGFPSVTLHLFSEITFPPFGFVMIITALVGGIHQLPVSVP